MAYVVVFGGRERAEGDGLIDLGGGPAYIYASGRNSAARSLPTRWGWLVLAPRSVYMGPTGHPPKRGWTTTWHN